MQIRIFRQVFNIGCKDGYVSIKHGRGGGNIAPRGSEIVVEAGVHHGRDTAMFAKLAKEVIAFEPSPRNYENAESNLRRFRNIQLINKGLWNESDLLTIRYGKKRGDDGFLQPDSEEISKTTIEIEVDTLQSFVNELGLHRVDFLKIEAEGAEPEVLQGLGDLRPRVIVVNAGPERDGQPVFTEIFRILEPKGYGLVAMKGDTLFFTKHSGTASLSRNTL
jgi:FkbM family methyltransferase